MIWINFKRILRTGFVNFWRNGVVSLSAVFVMSITLLIVASVMFTSALFDHTLQGLKEKVDVNVNILPVALEDEIMILKKSLESLPEVELVEYISRADVLKNYRERHADEPLTISAIDELSDNPFGATLNVRAKQPEHYESIQNFLEQNYGTGDPDTIVDTVNYAKKEIVIQKMTSIINAGEKLGAIITFVFILLSILITLNTIRLAMFISRDEIKVMNLVGADSSYISGPFMVTGAMYGVFSSIFVLIILYPITYWIGPKIAPIFFDMNVFNYYISNFGEMFIVIFISGIVVGSISSLLAINRYIKK